MDPETRFIFPPRGYEAHLLMHLARGENSRDLAKEIINLIQKGEEQSPPPFRWRARRRKESFLYDIWDKEDGLDDYGYIHLDTSNDHSIVAKIEKKYPTLLYGGPNPYGEKVGEANPIPNPQLFYKVLNDFAIFLYRRYSSRIISFFLSPK